MRELILLLAKLVDFAFNVYIFLFIARALISWVSPDPYNPIVRILYRFTEPVLYPIRRFLSGITRNLMLDFSPFVAIILLYLVRSIILKILFSL